MLHSCLEPLLPPPLLLLLHLQEALSCNLNGAPLAALAPPVLLPSGALPSWHCSCLFMVQFPLTGH